MGNRNKREAPAPAAAVAPAPAVVPDQSFASSRVEKHRVVAGKSVTCKKGVLDGDNKDNRCIKVEWLAGGQDALDTLVKRGYVEKYK